MLKKTFSLDNLWYFLIGFTIFRLFYLAINFRPLNTDEAQYWLWSQHLSFGYHSKPPLIAWIISLTTHLFGNNYFGARFMLPICLLITTYFLYLTAKKLFNKEIAKWVGLSFFFLPSVVVSATIISTDPLMLMFWACALFFLIYALQHRNLFYWLFLGVAIGLSALSKYTGLVFLLSLFLYLIFNCEVRSWLKSYKFYLMLAVVGLVLLPNIIWNIQHGFSTINHLVYHNANIQGLKPHPVNAIKFILSQLGIFSIIFLPIYLYCTFVKKYWQDNRFKLLWWFSLPMFLMIVLEALFSRAYANWAAATYLAATILVTAILIKNKAYRWLKINLSYCIIIMLAFYVVDFGVMHGLIKLPRYPRVYRASFGWESAGRKIHALSQRYPQANFVFDNREIWAKSVYFAHLPLNKVYIWNNQSAGRLEMFASWNQAHNQVFIWLSFGECMQTNMRRSFKKIRKLKPIGLKNYRTIYVYYLEDFSGLEK